MKKLFFFIFFFSFLSIFRELNITLMFHDFKIGPNAMDKPSLHPLPCFEIYYSLSNYTRVFWKHLNCSSCATIIYLFIYWVSSRQVGTGEAFGLKASVGYVL